MGLLDALPWGRRRRGGAPRAEGESITTGDLNDPKIREFLRSGGLSTASGAIINPGAALKVGAANRCTSLICSAVKTVPVDLKRRVDASRREDASDHPLWTVLRRKPNDWQTPSQFRQYMQLCVLNRGNAIAQIVRGARNRIIALNPLNPDWGELKQQADLKVRFEYQVPGQGYRTLHPGEYLHLAGMSSDGFKGQSVISFARESLGLSIQTEKHAAKLFKNGISLGSIFTHPKRLGDNGVLERLKASLDEFRGADNAHKALFLEEGITRQGVEMNSVDAQFIQTREMTLLEIAMFYGVPPHLLGLTTKTTSWGSGIEQQGIAFVAYTLQDWFTMWQESLERDCLDFEKDADLYVRLNPAGLIRGDIKTRYAAYAIGRQWGWLSINDVREKEDQDPIEHGDDYLVPLNMTPADALGVINALNSLGGGAEMLALLNNNLQLPLAA